MCTMKLMCVHACMCDCAYMCAFTCTYLCVYMHVHKICIQVSVILCACINKCLHTGIYAGMHVGVRSCIHAGIHACTHAFVMFPIVNLIAYVSFRNGDRSQCRSAPPSCHSLPVDYRRRAAGIPPGPAPRDGVTTRRVTQQQRSRRRTTRRGSTATFITSRCLRGEYVPRGCYLYSPRLV